MMGRVQVALVVFDRFVLAEVMTPYDVLERVPGIDVTFVGLDRGMVTDRTNAMAVRATVELEAVPEPDAIIVSGGLAHVDDARFLAWLADAGRSAAWVTSVGVGSLLLARAGFLQATEATTHWAFQDQLAQLGAIPVPDRIVERGRVITAAGVTAGYDLGLTLAEHLSDRTTAEAVQLWMEYDPRPPFDTGSVAKASEQVISRARELLELRSPSPTPTRTSVTPPIDE